MKGILVSGAVLMAVAVAGCGGQNSNSASTVNKPAELKAPQNVLSGQTVDASQFPRTNGKKTLNEIATAVNAQRDLTFAPGAQELLQGKINRLPFGIFTQDHNPIWSPTVVYVAKSATSPATGPYPATSYAFDVPAQFRSETSKADYDTIGNGVYVANVKSLPKLSVDQVMTLTNVDGKFHATVEGLGFQQKPSTPAPGQKVPNIDTPTLASVGGPANVASIDTRVPPDHMHNVSLKTALAQHKPVFLVFATPKLCVSRVCGPVTDEAEYLNSKYGKQMVFIHNEIYNGNKVDAGYRPEVGRFGLPTEPYVFVIDRQGRVYRKFEGPVAIPELAQAILGDLKQP